MLKLNFKQILSYYFGFLQIPHLVMNFFVLFVVERTALRSAISPNLTSAGLEAFLFTAYLDFFITSPLGLIFLYGLLKNKAWTEKVGIIALTSALVSGLAYYYQLVVFGALEVNLLNIAVVPIFGIPLVLLFLAPFSKRVFE